MSRFLYTARLVPLDVPVTMPDQNRRPLTITYREDTLAIQATRPHDVKVLLRHDRSLEIGRLTSLITHRGWWFAEFTVDEAIELQVGDPVSAGVVTFERGSGEPILKEVSLVTRGRVDGAQIIRKDRLPSLPAARGSSSSDRALLPLERSCLAGRRSAETGSAGSWGHADGRARTLQSAPLRGALLLEA